MTLKIYQLNSITGLYNETSYLYVAHNLTDTITDTGRKPIKFEPTTYTAPWKISYSLDEGLTWTDIATGITDVEYIWTPSNAEYNAILNGNPSYDARAIIFKVTDDALTEVTANCSIYKTSLTTGNIKPNHTITLCTGDTLAAQSNVNNHLDPIYFKDAVVLEASEIWYSEANLFAIYVERYTDQGTYHKLKANTHPKALTATWIFDSMLMDSTGQPLSSLLGANEVIRLHFIAEGVAPDPYLHSGNHAYGTWFAYTEEFKTETHDAAHLSAYAPRTDMFSRIGIEKAVYLDEAIPLAQLEAGDGIIIAQRDNEGKRVNKTGGIEAGDENYINYSKAYNLVIQSKINDLPDTGRFKKGWFEVLENNPSFTPRADGLSDDDVTWRTGTYCMGSPFYYDIAHNWNLEGEHQGNFKLEVYNVTGNTLFTKPVAEMIPNWEVIGPNTIRVYVIIKDDSQYQPAEPKDNVTFGISESSRWFYYNLTEVIPDIPTVRIIDTTSITDTGMTVSGDVKYIGGAEVTERGFVWARYDQEANPEIGKPNCSSIAIGKGRGTFNGLIGVLTPSTQYYIRAYAKNSFGTAYSSRILRLTTA